MGWLPQYQPITYLLSGGLVSLKAWVVARGFRLIWLKKLDFVALYQAMRKVETKVPAKVKPFQGTELIRTPGKADSGYPREKV
jgi:hypothetical protein